MADRTPTDPDGSDIDHAEATRVSRDHEKARQRAIEDTAERNRKAHEEARRQRVDDDRFRRELNRHLER